PPRPWRSRRTALLRIRSSRPPSPIGSPARRIEEWRDELATRWGTEVAMTGSGAALFAYFSTVEEAADAAAGVDLPTRLAVGAGPVANGWVRLDD
ncbi:MAG: hypothetical protein R6W79_04495, partial [Acidimicrobiia bacterium]